MNPYQSVCLFPDTVLWECGGFSLSYLSSSQGSYHSLTAQTHSCRALLLWFHICSPCMFLIILSTSARLTVSNGSSVHLLLRTLYQPPIIYTIKFGSLLSYVPGTLQPASATAFSHELFGLHSVLIKHIDIFKLAAGSSAQGSLLCLLKDITALILPSFFLHHLLPGYWNILTNI